MTCCPNCERLEEENRALKAELGFRLNEAETAALVLRLRVSPTEAKLLNALYRAKGRTVSMPVLMDELPLDGDHRSVKVLVGRIRRKLGPDVIETVWGRGFQLTAPGLSMVLGAIQPPELQHASTV